VRVAISVSFEVVNPETIAISLVTLWPVLIKFVVRVDMSESLPVVKPEIVVISAAKVAPVVAKFPVVA